MIVIAGTLPIGLEGIDYGRDDVPQGIINARPRGPGLEVGELNSGVGDVLVDEVGPVGIHHIHIVELCVLVVSEVDVPGVDCGRPGLDEDVELLSWAAEFPVHPVFNVLQVLGDVVFVEAACCVDEVFGVILHLFAEACALLAVEV